MLYILFKDLKMKIFLLVFCCVMFGCKEKKVNKKQQTTKTTAVNKHYDFNQPHLNLGLPSILNEVSGIFLLNDSIMLCQEDERGRLYLFNLKTAQVDKIISFGSADDYEDLTMLEGIVYLINSKGTIVSVTNYLQEPLLVKFNTSLSKKNDAEGLCYDSVSQSFLITCKELQGEAIVNKDDKVVYQFHLETKQITEHPFLIFNEANFKPSALAVHPITKNIFILSASKEKLLEVARDGSILTNFELKKSIFPQPEGLAFAKNGDLYISNEASGGQANILLFKYVKD